MPTIHDSWNKIACIGSIIMETDPIDCQRVTLVFNNKASEAPALVGLAYDELTRLTLDGNPEKTLVVSIMAHGPISPPGTEPSEHPDRDKVFLTVLTRDVDVLKRAVRERTKVPFEVKPSMFNAAPAMV